MAEAWSLRLWTIHRSRLKISHRPRTSGSIWPLFLEAEHRYRCRYSGYHLGLPEPVWLFRRRITWRRLPEVRRWSHWRSLQTASSWSRPSHRWLPGSYLWTRWGHRSSSLRIRSVHWLLRILPVQTYWHCPDPGCLFSMTQPLPWRFHQFRCCCFPRHIQRSSGIPMPDDSDCFLIWFLKQPCWYWR